ncbi:MAG: nicotinate-nucleotide adenylyltransferase, partial [Myxococcota bacterium]|nr:nicotinate-nucleotide adenylyltransferase [Myxococcota bacterium]
MPRPLSATPEPGEGPRIAHFGGSFNPVHDGHLAVARRLVADHGFTRVVFSPTSGAYGKGGLAPEGDRLALLEAAIQGDPALLVRDAELGRETPMSTLQALEELHDWVQSRWPQASLFAVRGADAVAAMARWRSLEALTDLAQMIVVPREGTDLEALFRETPSLQRLEARFSVMRAEGLPTVSSTMIRRRLFEGRREGLAVPGPVLDMLGRRGMYGLVAPGQGWITLTRPSYSGAQKEQRDKVRDETFGVGAWRTAFGWGDEVLTYAATLALYEDAYMDHFARRPEDLEWLVQTACQVYDNSETNVASGLDYTVQEMPSTHLQDIAVRRCLVRLGRRFRGDHLVEIRGRESEGFRLNPGQVAFHRPERILDPEIPGWWLAGSVESFWQSNKLLQVREGVFDPQRPLVVHLVALGPEETILATTRDGRLALPRMRFDAGVGFAASVNDAARALGLSDATFAPICSEPLVDDGAVHI